MRKINLNLDSDRAHPLIRDRAGFIEHLDRSHKVVAHIGCTDSPYTTYRIETGSLLHARLVGLAQVVGIDVDLDGLDRLSQLLPGSEYAHIDVSGTIPEEHRHRYDLVLAGEVLEHVPNPGHFMRGCRSLIGLSGELCVTVPNACSPKIGVRAMFGREAVHPDHLVYYSPRTLERTLRDAGFEVLYMGTYFAAPGPVGRVLNQLLMLDHAFFHGPIGEGVIAIARPVD